jgi:hypothetical protein
MSDLKTLKDFEFDDDGYFINDGVSDKDRLRQEAIKWVKKYINQKKNWQLFFYNEEDLDNWNNIVSEPTVRWIKHFFDLSEDELK